MHWFCRATVAVDMIARILVAWLLLQGTLSLLAVILVLALLPNPESGPGIGIILTVISVGAAVFIGTRPPLNDREQDDAPHCTSCGYNLTGNVSGVCPECGSPVPERAADMAMTLGVTA
jgi:hypothetical protein